ncbi:MAG: terminase family protein, partial [Clostridia bacterium]|nr:terminase family protein [Clostridia bacterium]
ELIKSKDGKDFIIELTNGSKLIFFSVEQTHAIRGFTLDFLIWDEVSHSREYTPDGEHIYYNIVSPLLDARGKKEIYISTPNGRSGFFYNEAMKALNGEKGYAYLKVSVYQDETKSPEWIEEKRASYPEFAFRQEYLCEFLEGGISFFKGFGKLFKDESFDWNTKLVAGVDFSSVGSDNTVLTIMNEYRQVYQYIITGSLDEKYQQIADYLNQLGSKVVRILMESNSIGAVMSNEIKKLLCVGLRSKLELFTTTNSSKADIIEKLALDIEQENISFQKNNEILKSEFETFTYTLSKTGKKVFGAVDGAHDDTILSLAFANFAWNTYMKKTNGNKIMVIRR